MTCYQLGTVQQYHLGTLEYHLGTLQYHDSQFANHEAQVKDRLAYVTDAENTLTRTWQNLQSAVAANPTNFPAPKFTQADIDAATTAAHAQIDAANNALQQAKTQADAYDKQAEQLLQTATDFVAWLKCQ